MPEQNDHFKSMEDIEKILPSIPSLNYQDLNIQANSVYSLNAETSRIEKLTLNEGSILEIRTDINNVSALSIGEIVLNPNNKGAEIKFADDSRYKLHGSNGNNGRNGAVAQGASGRGGDGDNGGDGEDGETLVNRGTLWITVEKLSIVPTDRPIDRTALFVNAKGVQGGNGGNGGNGGDGGNGGQGGNGAHRCGVINCWCRRSNTQSGAGGNAGHGGKPGNAGGAGSGGEIYFTGPKSIFNQLSLITDVSISNAGTPGVGGKGGNKGIGGPSHHGGRRGGCRGTQPGANGQDGLDFSTVRGETNTDGNSGKFEHHDDLDLSKFIAKAFNVK